MLRTLTRSSPRLFPQATLRMASSQRDLTAAAPTPAGPKDANEKPWHAAFPTPTRSLDDGSLSTVTAQELREWIIRRKNLEENEFLVVDVRRTDFEEGFIKGAINLPAHSFYPTLPSLLPILSQYRSVVFHCQSSSGRGPRCAGWYQDALDRAAEGGAATSPSRSKAVVLTGGIKEWIKQYGDDDEVTVKL